ncbi:MAG TPA: pyridoxal-dependent decarboxylase [Candidatus Limnocylindria bacterium]
MSAPIPAAALDADDPAELGRLAETISRLLPELDRFMAGDGPDLAVAHRSEWVAALDRPLPEWGEGIEVVADELARWVIPYGLRTPDPGFMAYIIGRATTATLASGVAAQVAGHFRYFLTSFSFLEELSLRWLADLCRIPPDTFGVYSSGGSTANLLAIGAARQAAFERIGVDVSADGLPAGVRGRVYGGTEVHHTIQRATGVLGLGRRAFAAIESDTSGRMDATALDRRLRADMAEGMLPIAIVAVAGTTATGAIDDIDAIADVAAAHGVWLHVDGAYGLPAAGLPELARQFRGVERGDSWIIDPHKWLGTPGGCGATYVRDGDLLERAFTQEPAPYLEAFAPESARSAFDDQGIHWFDRSVELSSPSRGVWVWASLREIGADGMRERVRRHLGFARHLADRAVEHPRLELLDEPTLSICCFRYRTGGLDEPRLDALNTEIVQTLRAETRLVPSTTRIQGRLAIRPCFVNAATTLAEVEALAESVVEIGDRLAR